MGMSLAITEKLTWIVMTGPHPRQGIPDAGAATGNE